MIHYVFSGHCDGEDDIVKVVEASSYDAAYSLFKAHVIEQQYDGDCAEPDFYLTISSELSNFLECRLRDTKDTPPRVRLVCPECGSEDIRRDALAYWDDVNQAWALCGTLDEGSCNDCAADGIRRFREEKIN
jgi:hypothetical protein